MNRAERVDWWRAFLPVADGLVAAGPVKTSLGEPPPGRPKTPSPSPPRLVQAHLNSQSGAHSRAHRRRSFFVTPLQLQQLAASIKRNLRRARFPLSVPKATPAVPGWSLRHGGRFSPTVKRRCDLARQFQSCNVQGQAGCFQTARTGGGGRGGYEIRSSFNFGARVDNRRGVARACDDERGRCARRYRNWR